MVLSADNMRSLKMKSVLFVSTLVLAFIFAIILQSSVHAGGGVGSGGGGTGGTGGAQSSYGWGWYNFPSNGNIRPQYMRDGSSWSNVMNRCTNEGANRIIAFIVFQSTKTVATSVVYDYHDSWIGFPGYNGGNGGNWLTVNAARAFYNSIDASYKTGFDWGTNVAWFCYDSTPPSAKITAEASVSASSIVLGNPVTFTNDLKISNVNNTKSDTFDYKITSSGTAALPAAGTKSYSNVSIDPARTTINGKSYTFTPTAAGIYCRRIKASGAPNYVVYSNNPAEACVTVGTTVVANYILTPNITVNPGAIEAGVPLIVSSSVKNDSNTNSASNPTTWTLTRQVNSNSPTVVSTGGNVIYQPGVGTPGPGTTDNNTSGLNPGDQVCFFFTLTPHSVPIIPSVPPDTVTASDCAVVGKKPKTQIWAGDLLVGGNVTTSTSTIDSNTYGSWAEYGIIASGGISGAASGAAFAGPSGMPGATVAGYSALSYANTNNHQNCVSTQPIDSNFIGCYQTSGSMSEVEASFPGGSPINSPTIRPNTLDGIYTAGNITLNQSLNLSKTVVIKSSGTVTIADDQTYSSGPYTKTDQLPQLVIIANNIIINSNVRNIDAWLVATRTPGSYIYTCEVNSRSTGDCINQLQINGPIMTNHIYLRRTAGSDSSDMGKPAEIFNLRADAYLWAINYASAKTRIQTVYTTELPPRF
jgi:hypothetical protein